MVQITEFEIKWREEFTRRLKARAEEIGFTRKDLSEQSGISYTEICFMYRGMRIPHATTIVKLAQALAVNPGYLIEF